MDSTIVNGGDVFMSLSGNVISHATSHSLSISMSARDTSNKTNGVYTARESGRLDVTASCEGMGFYSGTTGMDFLLEAIVARTAVAMVFYENAHQYATGNFFITSAEISAPDQDNVTFSISLELANTFELGSF